jgi:hypothetical protein
VAVPVLDGDGHSLDYFFFFLSFFLSFFFAITPPLARQESTHA